MANERRNQRMKNVPRLIREKQQKLGSKIDINRNMVKKSVSK